MYRLNCVCLPPSSKLHSIYVTVGSDSRWHGEVKDAGATFFLVNQKRHIKQFKVLSWSFWYWANVSFALGPVHRQPSFRAPTLTC